MLKHESRGSLEAGLKANAHRALVALCRAVLLVVSFSGVASQAEERLGDATRGRELFQKQCAACHGDQGQGVEDRYSDPLEGDYPSSHLLEIIEETMPEAEPEACVGQDAADVAAFVYQEFYSQASKLKRQTARVELSRLTVQQYRNTITDLIRHFSSPGRTGEGSGGLKASYFNTRKLDSDDLVIERFDAQIAFDFEEGTPEPSEEFEPEEFAITWEGGLIVDDTGIYKLRLRCENGAKLWLNDPDIPLIDAWVRSGDETDRVAEVFLLGGRTYPLQVHFFKNKEKRASISLGWETPGGTEEIIPAENFTSGAFPKLFVVTADFPPDDSSLGYERGSSASKAWTEAMTTAAVETANAVVQRLDELTGSDPQDTATARRARIQDFCQRFVERAFRRPLSEVEMQVYVDRYFEESSVAEQALKQVIIYSLKSPRFLYPNIDPASSDNYAVATRLSYALWDSSPDRVLLEAACEGKLQTQAQVQAQARRMMHDPRTRAKLRGFFRNWLEIDPDRDLSKDQGAYPGFDSHLAADLRRSLEQFVEETVWGEDPDFRRLLLGETLLVNERIARFFDIDPPDDGFAPVKLDEPMRAGILTHPYMLAVFAHRHSSSPIHRGVFILRRILGRALRSPPDAIDLLDETLHPHMTTRERVELQTKPESCQKCHGMINPLGFAFEGYDGVGRFRSSEKAREIDSSGRYQTLDGEFIEFNNARELAESLASSSQTYRSFVQEIFVHLVKQPIQAYGPNLWDELTSSFCQLEYDIRELVVQVATVAAMPLTHTSEPHE